MSDLERVKKRAAELIRAGEDASPFGRRWLDRELAKMDEAERREVGLVLQKAHGDAADERLCAQEEARLSAALAEYLEEGELLEDAVDRLPRDLVVQLIHHQRRCPPDP